MEKNINGNKKTSKETWLFLIFLDVIVLCVLGFFIYNSFFGSASSDQANEEPMLEEVMVEDLAVDEPMSEPAAIPQEKIETKAEAKTQVKAEPVKEAQAKPVETKTAQANASAPKRRSVFVSGNGKAKKVTFKYYGDASSVAVVGGFTSRKPIAMKKNGNEWSVTLGVYPGEYRYMYVIDGKEMLDPNGRMQDGRTVFKVN
ncbi:MAG: hypothetical protein LBM71_03395 [Elusimicrobiota bacterium]|jgi:flagellar basal body-associated protein FliL|nr:hypothetical protein [Elusimicrobiota bacterium]